MRAPEASMDHDTDQPASAAPLEDGQGAILERLGMALREARQQRGIARAALASKLCMGEEQLTALEEADQGKLPEPVFVIAQSRRVADALGLDISLLIAPLKAGASSSAGRPGAEALGRLPSRPAAAGRGGSVHRLRRARANRDGGGAIRWLAGGALLAGVATAGVTGWPALQGFVRTVAALGQAPAPSPRPAAPATARPATRPAAMPAAVPTGQLLVSATQPSWLEVQSAGRQVLFKGTFKGERLFPIGQGVKLLAGRPDLVRVRVGSAAARPLGAIDQIRWVSISVPADRPTAPERAPAP